MKSEHQRRVEEFMARAGQDIPDSPTVPDADTRILRAKLILEEALETIEALGVSVVSEGMGRGVDVPISKGEFEKLNFSNSGQVDIVEVADGCADIRVVTTGTLSAFGIADEALQREVDEHNLKKFGPGGYRRESDGKWIKPADLQPPDIKAVIGI